ncbi:MAG: hypothetical protein HKN57_13340 [Xanthomonadales bacterium]|nr:hypothetical protein [Xanthomonadales bacterium]
MKTRGRSLPRVFFTWWVVQVFGVTGKPGKRIEPADSSQYAQLYMSVP